MITKIQSVPDYKLKTPGEVAAAMNAARVGGGYGNNRLRWASTNETFATFAFDEYITHPLDDAWHFVTVSAVNSTKTAKAFIADQFVQTIMA